MTALRAFATFFGPWAAIFLAVHFPLRIAVHFAMTRSGLLAANAILFASFLFVEALCIAYVVERHWRRAALRALRGLPALAAARVLYVLGFVLAIRWMLHAWMVVAEGRGPFDALRESWHATRGASRRILVMALPPLALAGAWLLIGYASTAMTLRALRGFPIFKIAPLTMTLAEMGLLWLLVLTFVVYERFSSHHFERFVVERRGLSE